MRCLEEFMHKVTADIFELLIGALLLGLGLLYLTSQSRTTEGFIKIVENELIETEDLYGQYSTADINLVSSHELYAVIIGNREFPIVIDGNIIEPDKNDYSLYFSCIKEGKYNKSYRFDQKHNIIQIIYEYAGL